MVFCLFCSRKYKTKKAYKSHAESQSHKEKEKDIRKDIKKFRKMFITNISSFIHRYDTYKDIEEVYRAYIKDNMIGYRDVEYKDISTMVRDLNDVVDLIEKDNKFFVKGFDRFVVNEKPNKLEESTSDDMSTEDISDYEEFDGNYEHLVSYLKDI